MPEWDEKITIETWPLEPKRIEFEKDYLVRDANGEVIIRAVSVWVLMDIHQRRLKHNDAIGIHYPSVIKERALEKKLGKLMAMDILKKYIKK